MGRYLKVSQAREIITICLLSLFISQTDAQVAAIQKKTYTYKIAGQTKILADVYRSENIKVRPVVVWIHGGALIVGNRHNIPSELLNLCRTEDYILISIDYRLAPEVKLPEIIEDLKAAFHWIHTRGPGLFQADTHKIVVAGGSAGGYLTMMTGICVIPRPRALISYWGYGDVDGPWYTSASNYYRDQVPLVSKEEAYKAVGNQVLTGTDGDVARLRGRFYHYLRQNGYWTQQVSGFDPISERSKLDRFCPVRNITSDYPPILMIHGTADTDVPFEESASMARELARHHVPNELITIPGAGHGLAGGDKKLIADAHERVLKFIREHLK